MKALRHDAPGRREAAAAGSASSGGCAFVFKVSHGGNMGRLALARVFGGTLSEGTELKAASGDMVRVGTLFAMQGEKPAKLGKAASGDVVAIAKVEGVNPGEWLGTGGKAPILALPASNYGLAIATRRPQG
jgi:elongation factor G